jgi:choline dehydrogenase
MGIDVVADLPVGEHLLDHPNCVYRIAAPELAEMVGRLFAVNCRGPIGLGGEPEWQLFALPIDEVEGHAGIVVCLNRGDSEGVVMIRSADPAEPPLIDHRYLSVESDVQRFEHAFAFCDELLGTTPFQRVGARAVHAGVAVRDVVAFGVGTAQHPVGTCKMGPAGHEGAVVDDRLAVHGLENLLVADSSIFPDNVMNNTNLTCFLIGEIGADRVRERLGTERAAARAG